MSFTQINQQQVTPGFIAAVVAAIPSDSISGTQIENNTITGNNLSPANAAGLLNNDGSGNLSYVPQSSLSISSSQVSGLGTAAGNNTGDFISSSPGSVTSTNIASNTILGSNLVNNTLNDTQIQAQGISATSIANGTITSTQIAGNTVSGGSSGNIAANTITATNMTRHKDTATAPSNSWGLTATPASDVYLQVYKNGLLLTNGADYNLSGSTVSIVDTIVGTDVFNAIYEVA